VKACVPIAPKFFSFAKNPDSLQASMTSQVFLNFNSHLPSKEKILTFWMEEEFLFFGQGQDVLQIISTQVPLAKILIFGHS
jgi:hypothetical protein